MNHRAAEIPAQFYALVDEIPRIGFKHHASSLISLVANNDPFVEKSIKDVPLPRGAKAKSALIISAGPSVRRKESIPRIHRVNYQGTIVATDGSYIACLKAGLIPDYVVTLDPHPMRMVRWFGDPDFENNAESDDYFARQDLDMEFRNNNIIHNRENIKLVDRYAPLTKLIVATSISESLRRRLSEAKFDMYWWNPLVDNPRQADSLTRRMYEMNRLPCMNTGGTVGSASWVFVATRLKMPMVGLVGMDFGYYEDTPLEKTQTYYELVHRLGSEERLENYFISTVFPLTGEKFYSDPTYFWYRQNFIELLNNAPSTKTFNCTEGGTLTEGPFKLAFLEDFLAQVR